MNIRKQIKKWAKKGFDIKRAQPEGESNKGQYPNFNFWKIGPDEEYPSEANRIFSDTSKHKASICPNCGSETEDAAEGEEAIYPEYDLGDENSSGKYERPMECHNCGLFLWEI